MVDAFTLCLVAGNTVWSHVAGDDPLWVFHGELYTTFNILTRATIDGAWESIDFVDLTQPVNDYSRPTLCCHLTLCSTEQRQADRLWFRSCRHVSGPWPVQTQRDLLRQLRVRVTRDTNGSALHSTDVRCLEPRRHPLRHGKSSTCAAAHSHNLICPQEPDIDDNIGTLKLEEYFSPVYACSWWVEHISRTFDPYLCFSHFAPDTVSELFDVLIS